MTPTPPLLSTPCDPDLATPNSLSPKKLGKLAQREILKELLEREESLSQRKLLAKPSEEDLRKVHLLMTQEMFPKSREFFFDSVSESRFRAACGGRRAAKTTGAAIKLLVTETLNPKANSLYTTISTTSIKDQIWPELRGWIDKYELPFDIKETTLKITRRHSSGQILLRGASDKKQMQKRRGGKLILAICDEAGIFGKELQGYARANITPSLRDLQGEFLLIGSPPEVPEGLFAEIIQGRRPNWAFREWNITDNIFLSPKARDLELIRKEEGLAADDPIFIMEWLGKLCVDHRVTVFVFEANKNGFEGDADIPPDARYWLGVDFGFNDETALVVLAWVPDEPTMWVVESWGASGQTSDPIADKIIELKSKWGITRVIGDTGGYGKGVAEEIWKDYGIFIEQAKKSEKLNHIKFMNAAFLRQELWVNLTEDDGVAAELPKVRWDDNKKAIHNRARDNKCMALLYVWRAARDVAGKTPLVESLTEAQRQELIGYPEDEIRDKLGLFIRGDQYHPDDEKLWYLQDI